MADDAPVERDLVVIGASAGGVEVLRRIVADLPSSFPAAVCIVLHLAPRSPSALGAILQRAGPLPSSAAVDGDTLRPSQILVAPPDRHLLVDAGHVRVAMGPRERGHRPAIDLLFRSAARTRGPHVIGVIVSGTQDDGAAGLAAIKAAGGLAVIQDPDEAQYPGMPASALARTGVDAIVPSWEIGATLSAMVRGPDGAGAGETPHAESLA